MRIDDHLDVEGDLGLEPTSGLTIGAMSGIYGGLWYAEAGTTPTGGWYSGLWAPDTSKEGLRRPRASDVDRRCSEKGWT